MFEQLLQLDQLITATISSLLPHNDLLDFAFSFLSLQGLTVIVWLVLFGYFVYREHSDRTHRHFLYAFVPSFGATWFTVNVILKNIFMRERPWVAQQLTDITCPDDFSFPSGHASGAFVGAVIFSYFDPKRAWLYYGIAVLISLSRIYLVCHYFLDVLIGALVGYVIGKVILKILASRNII